MEPMVEKSSKIKFAERLCHALDALGWKHRGRPKQLQLHYSMVGVNLSEKTFHKWLKGQSLPDWDNLIHLAKLTQRSICYLIYGLEEAELLQPSHEHKSYSHQELENAFLEALEQAAMFNLVSFSCPDSPEKIFRAFTRELALNKGKGDDDPIASS